ncbi:MAG: C4-type zinc ribbon domain-containing protein [Chthoniobacterales bacterium]
MQPELERLLVLQNREQKIRQIQSEMRNLPLQRQQLDAQLAATIAKLEALKLRARHLEVDRKKLELDVGTRNGSIARLRTQQYETRKNDEFAALGHEIERYQKEITAIEDQELELMEQGDRVKGEVVVEEKSAGAARASIGRQVTGLDEKATALQTQLEDLKKERTEIAKEVDEDLLDRFERLFASKGDAAVVALEHEVCTGCHMKITAQTAVRVKGGKEIVSCEQCGRILYFSE